QGVVACFPATLTHVGRARAGCRAALAPGMPFELRVASAERYPIELLYATGSDTHVHGLERIARQRGLELDRSGLRGGTPAKRLSVEDEAGVYRHLGLPYLPPEVR